MTRAATRSITVASSSATSTSSSAWARDESVVSGTMHHGSLESDEFRRAFLADAAAFAGREFVPSTASFAAARAARLDLLGDLAEKHLDVDALLAPRSRRCPGRPAARHPARPA